MPSAARGPTGGSWPSHCHSSHPPAHRPPTCTQSWSEGSTVGTGRWPQSPACPLCGRPSSHWQGAGFHSLSPEITCHQPRAQGCSARSFLCDGSGSLLSPRVGARHSSLGVFICSEALLRGSGDTPTACALDAHSEPQSPAGADQSPLLSQQWPRLRSCWLCQRPRAVASNVRTCPTFPVGASLSSSVSQSSSPNSVTGFPMRTCQSPRRLPVLEL